jgi:hypothetical protein
MKDMKSAFVLDLPSGQERIFCQNCAEDFADSAYPEADSSYSALFKWLNVTPVTLTCEAKCSKCGEEI